MGSLSVGFLTSVMASLWEDGSDTGALMLCVGLVLRVEHILQANKELVYYYHIGVPRQMVANRRNTKEELG